MRLSDELIERVVTERREAVLLGPDQVQALSREVRALRRVADHLRHDASGPGYFEKLGDLLAAYERDFPKEGNNV